MMRICLFEQQFTSTSSIPQILDKSIKKRRSSGASSAKSTKSDDSTMETIPNCTNLHRYFCIKNMENWLHVLIFYGILKQNRIKMCLGLHISTVHLSFHKPT